MYTYKFFIIFERAKKLYIKICFISHASMQLINRNGFYSETLEWISITGLQICGSMSNITKQNLSSRFLAKAKYLIMGYVLVYKRPEMNVKYVTKFMQNVIFCSRIWVSRVSDYTIFLFCVEIYLTKVHIT